MKKISLLSLIIVIVFVFQSNVKSPKYSSVPPTGYTGASGDYCVSCHADFSLNSGGGSVSTTGLPVGTYNAGQEYNFSLNINHSSNRSKWGFSIAAINSSGQPVGTFSSTNTNASLNNSELSHNGAVSTSSQTSYSYTNLKWTAPASPTNNDKNVTFYYVANAANGTGGTDGDYIYAGSTAVALPATLTHFTANIINKTILLNWQVNNQLNVNYYEVEKSDNAQTYYTIQKMSVTNNETNFSYTDKNISYYNKPIFYRLKVVDKDGSFKYSSIIQTKIYTNNNFVSNLYPTIVANGTSVTAEILSESNKKITLSLIDISGREVQKNNFNVQKGTNKINFTINTAIKSNWLFARFSAADMQQTISLMSH